MTTAERCRANGWTVGTVLGGGKRRGGEELLVRITAIGERRALGVRIDCPDEPETMWWFDAPDWHVVSQKVV